MTTPDDRKRTEATARQLAASLDSMRAELAAVRQQAEETAIREAETRERGEATRKLTWRTILAVGFDIVVTVVAAVAVVMAHSNGVSVSQLHDNTVTVCQQSNHRLALEKGLWEFLLARSTAGPNPTPAQKHREEVLLRSIQLHVDQAYAIRNCQNLYRGG